MSYFTGWFESVVRADAKLDRLVNEYERLEKSLLATIKLEEMRIGKSFNSELIENKLDELGKELYLSQMDIKLEISKAFDKHFERNKEKEINNGNHGN